MTHVNEAGLFDDLKIKAPVHTQPELVNPKTGKPFNLKDPEYPVVDDPNHKFKWSYWAMPKTNQSVLVQYLVEHWEYFNRTRFGGRLKKPSILLMKDVSALKMKKRGYWVHADRELVISPNLFNAPHEGWVNRVLIHEMCHQAESEKFGFIENVKKGHGPRWVSEMRSAGLHPSQFDYESNETYADRKEKVVFEKIAKELEPFKQAVQVLNGSRQKLDKKHVRIGLKVLFATKKGIMYGVVMGDSSKKGSASIEVMNLDHTLTYWDVSKTQLYLANAMDIHHGRFEA